MHQLWLNTKLQYATVVFVCMMRGRICSHGAGMEGNS